MASAGDYLHYQRHYRRIVVNLTLLASDTPTTVGAALVAALASHTAFIQLIVVSVTTDAAQALAFKDTASTPVLVGATPVSPGLGVRRLDYGPAGIPLTEGKALDMTGVAGLAGQIHIEGYWRQTSPLKAQNAGQNGMT